ncbi:MAG: hypothetical protein MUF00_19100 [Gemmatimonadaceae bacterium]|nr:hypothetical protein [Gemmatimonadaceae bacterium]
MLRTDAVFTTEIVADPGAIATKRASSMRRSIVVSVVIARALGGVPRRIRLGIVDRDAGRARVIEIVSPISISRTSASTPVNADRSAAETVLGSSRSSPAAQPATRTQVATRNGIVPT